MRKLLTLLVLASSFAFAQTPQGGPATQTFHQLLESEWEYTMQQNPDWASMLGDRRWNDRWSDLSPAAYDARHKHRVEVLGKIKQISREQLSPVDQLNYDLFRRDYEDAVEGHQYGWHLAPVSHQGGIQTANQISDLLRFQTVKDYEDWIARMRAVPQSLEQTIALMREGMKRKVMRPKILMQRVIAQLDKQLPADAKQSGFFDPFERFPDNISEAERKRLSSEAEQVIATAIVPAYRKFKTFFESEYLPASYDQIGAWQMPNGDAFYAFRARQQTTTKLTPQQIHEIGLKEVARIRAEMQKVMQQVGFKGTLQEFFKFLRTDPQFYYKSGEELLTAYRAMTREIDPKLTKVIGKLPRMPYGVEPIPDAIAPDTTAAYYQDAAADGSRPGTYYVNLYRPEMRPKYEMMALSIHEAVPGHHLQIALAQELGELPMFRRFGGYTAFVEGWALYSESLGDEMGLYEDPYAKFGKLTYEMWRAVRLVVDTGMHSMKWDRQRAIDYFLDNAAKSELDVVNEIDRYIGDPGQALAYKIGELKIKELRARATKELGGGFDVREFHDVVLSQGAVPLDVLEKNVDTWIAAKKSAPSKSAN